MTVIGSGLGSQFGFSATTATYGAYVAPTKFLRAKSYKITRNAERPQGEGIQAGNLGPLAAHYVETTEAATASIEFDVQTRNLGVLLEATTGGTSTSTNSLGTAYTQVHTLGDPYGKNFTVQAGVPFRAGASSNPHTLTGAKVVSADFSCDANGILNAKYEIDGQSWVDTQTLASASYVTTNVFHGKQMAFKMGTYSSEAAVSGVRSVSMSWKKSLDVADYTANATGLKGEPVLNGLYEITGSVEADWLAETTFQDLVVGKTSTALVWEFVGAQITSTYYETIRFTLPSVTFEGDSQGVDGVKELTNSWDFTWRYDGTNAPKITYITTDTAL